MVRVSIRLASSMPVAKPWIGIRRAASQSKIE